jgi:hypothetical protein
MKNLCYGLCIAVSVSLAGRAQGPVPADPDKAAIRQAAYDYGEGFYQGAAERMERAVHPAIIKRGVVSRPGSGSILMPMNAETLVELTRRGGAKETPADKRNISFELLDIRDDIASARIFTVQFNDYLHLVKQEGRWRIVHVLWQPPSPNGVANGEVDKAAVAQLLKDYFAALAAGDPAPVEHLTHVEAAVRMFRTFNPPAGKFFLMEGNRDALVGVVRAKQMPPLASVNVTMIDTYDTIASAAVTTPAMSFYWHLAKQNDQWRIVNGLMR